MSLQKMAHDSSFTIPNLDGPHLFHVYIAHSHKDRQIYEEILPNLIKSGFRVYEWDEDKPHSDNIDDGIPVCQKMLVIFTEGYRAEKGLSEYEKRAVIERAKYLGIHCLTLLLCGLKEDELDADFRNFPAVKYDVNGKADDKMEQLQAVMKILAQDFFLSQMTNDHRNMGYTLACSYFHGYLNTLLPGLPDRIKESNQMEIDGKVVMSKKFFIIVPESSYCPISLNDYNLDIKICCNIPFKQSHAGQVYRDYSSSVYEFDHDNEKFRVAAEFPAAVTVLRDMVSRSDCGLTAEQVTREIHMFFFHIKQCLEQNLAVVNKAKLLYYREKRDNFLEILASAVKREIEDEVRNPLTGSPSVADGFQLVAIPEKVSHLTSFSLYPMDHEIRGKAYIINIQEFDEGSKLAFRKGANVDQEKMKELFKYLRFEVEVFAVDCLTSIKIKDRLTEISIENLDQDQGIIFCIMSHGNEGQIFASDGVAIPIVDIIDYIKQNKTLFRKPKIFFIQSCQESENKPNSSEPKAESPLVKCSDEEYNSEHLGIKKHQNPLATFTSGIKQELLEVGQGDSVTSSSFNEVVCSDADSNNFSMRTGLVPSAPDFLMSYATLPRNLSYRHEDLGAFYINALDAQIRKLHKSLPLDQILRQVTKEVKLEMEEIFKDHDFNDRQFPFHVFTTEQQLFL